MMTEEIVRAWKDPEHRGELSPAPHPAGEIMLDPVAGSSPLGTFVTVVTCWGTCTFDAYCPTMYGTCAIDTSGCCVTQPY